MQTHELDFTARILKNVFVSAEGTFPFKDGTQGETQNLSILLEISIPLKQLLDRYFIVQIVEIIILSTPFLSE